MDGVWEQGDLWGSDSSVQKEGDGADGEKWRLEVKSTSQRQRGWERKEAGKAVCLWPEGQGCCGTIS